MAQTAVANSTIAGAVSYPVVAGLLTAVLAIAGVAIPPFSIGELVMTQAMDVSVASTILSYVIVHYTPDSVQQNIAALAKLAPKVLALVSVKTYSTPNDFPNPPPAITPSNLQNAAAAAVAVIQATTTGTTDFPAQAKSGALDGYPVS